MFNLIAVVAGSVFTLVKFHNYIYILYLFQKQTKYTVKKKLKNKGKKMLLEEEVKRLFLYENSNFHCQDNEWVFVFEQKHRKRATCFLTLIDMLCNFKEKPS